MIVQKTRVLRNVTTEVEFYDSGLFQKAQLYQYSTLPAWITKTLSGGFVGFILKLNVTPTTIGTYTYNFSTNLTSPPLPTHQLILEVVDSLTTPLTECYNSNDIIIIWINREGGRSSYIFNQRKDFGGNIGDSKTFDNNGIVKYFYKGKNFTNKVVYKTGISNNEVDLIESLRYSVQAWEYNPVTDVSTPILIDPNSYVKYNSKIKFNEISLKYRIAEYKEIQNQ